MQGQNEVSVDFSGLIQKHWQPSDPCFQLTSEQIAALCAYLEILNQWNRVHSLTAIEDPERQVLRHVVDALAAWPEIMLRFKAGSGIRIADVGSGMGVPGVVWALVMPDFRFDLIERQQKKAAFLRHVVARLGLASRVGVIGSDVTGIKPDSGYDLIVSRAFAALPVFLQTTFGISKPETLWAAMTGRQDTNISEQSLIKMNNKIGDVLIDKIVSLEIPQLQEERHLVWARRLS